VQFFRGGNVKHFFTGLFPFGGLGAGALGIVQSAAQLGDDEAQFLNLGGIDLDQAACADYELLTGAPSLQADLAKLTVEQLREFVGRRNEHFGLPFDRAPDFAFSSPPCKGFSRLMNSKKAATEKYQAMNRLVLQAMVLLCESWAKPPKLIAVENVPGIMSRGEKILVQVRQLLREYGFVFHEGVHDCGEVGGLAQHRRRFLMVARHEPQVRAFVHRPPKLRVRACGEVLEQLPVPGVTDEGGPMHVLPKLDWVNWVRLALIPAGGDWRDLPQQVQLGSAATAKNFKGRPGLYGVVDYDKPFPSIVAGMKPCAGSTPASVTDPRLFTPLKPGQDRREVFAKYDLRGWGDVARTVAGSGTNGGYGVADPRIGRHENKYRIEEWEKPTHTVIGSDRVGSGAMNVADPRGGAAMKANRGVLGVVDWGDPTGVIPGSSWPMNGRFSVADPRGPFHHTNKITDWEHPIGTITHSPAPSSGGGAVADPRWSNKYPVRGFDQPVRCLTGDTDVQAGAQSVADPRVNSGRNGFYGVIGWEDAFTTITGHGQHDNGSNSVADPRPKRPAAVPLIVSADGTWHRPISTLEMAALQEIPTVINGKPLVLAGTKVSGWRERIGNAVPRKAAVAIGNSMGKALLAAKLGTWFLSSDEIWVRRRDFYADPEGVAA
jgi:site-specific DNA-cytosine methylase